MKVFLIQLSAISLPHVLGTQEILLSGKLRNFVLLTLISRVFSADLCLLVSIDDAQWLP